MRIHPFGYLVHRLLMVLSWEHVPVSSIVTWGERGPRTSAASSATHPASIQDEMAKCRSAVPVETTGWWRGTLRVILFGRLEFLKERLEIPLYQVVISDVVASAVGKNKCDPAF